MRCPTKRHGVAMHEIVVSPLSLSEQRELISIESRIASGLSAFFDVAYAMMEIRERRLYREQFATFEDYCRERWDIRRAHAYRLIDAAQVCSKLSPIGDIPLPENECQVRPLTGLPEKFIEKAWKRACEKAGPAGKITGALVKRAVREVARRSVKMKKASREDWQVRIIPLLKEAVDCAKRGDKDATSEIVDRVSLWLMVGKRGSDHKKL